MCVKWGTLYGPEFVNRLYAMVYRNLTGPFRFICLTDDITNIRKEVETFPIESHLKGWWPKIQYFKSPLFDIEGPMLTIDLDNIIIDNIDCLFEYETDKFCMKKHPNPAKGGYDSCVMRFEVNQYSHIYDRLDFDKIDYSIDNSTKDFQKKKYWGDQIWITEQMKNDPNKRKVVTWPIDWVIKLKELPIETRRDTNTWTQKIIAWAGYKKDQRQDYDLIKHIWNEEI